MTTEPREGALEHQPAVDARDAVLFLNVLGSARAMRWLKTDPVPPDLVEKVLWGATRASSPRNSQPWDFVVVQDQARRRAIGDLIGPVKPSVEPKLAPDPVVRRSVEGGLNLAANLGNAPVIIFVCGREVDLNREAQLTYAYSAVYAAAQNLLVSARTFGLGTTFTTFHDHNEPAIRRLVGIPDDRFIGVTMPLGWPARRFGPVSRKPLKEVVHYETW